ncbi:MAG TPA: hypothetical protein VF669_04505 [Tepidisphaeraceae bacterium]|jgi:hypothetical protein
MSQNQEAPFDDPALKAAIKRVAGDERAPETLRQRIAAQMSADGGAIAAKSGFFKRHRRNLLAASIALLALGFVAYQVQENYFPSRATIISYNAVLPASFAEAMVQVHATNAARKDPTTIAASEIQHVKQKLAQQVGFAVLAPADLDADWHNRGAGVCSVGKFQAAYVLYAHGDQLVSLLSLPASALPNAPDGSQYAQKSRNAPLSGFKQGPGLYCLVAGADEHSPSLETLNTLRDHLRASSGRSGCSGRMREQVASASDR